MPSSRGGFKMTLRAPTASPERVGTKSAAPWRVLSNKSAAAQNNISSPAATPGTARGEEVADYRSTPGGNRSGQTAAILPEHSRSQHRAVRRWNGVATGGQ